MELARYVGVRAGTGWALKLIYKERLKIFEIVCCFGHPGSILGPWCFIFVSAEQVLPSSLLPGFLQVVLEKNNKEQG